MDSIIFEACQALGIERWGGESGSGWSKRSDFLRCPYRYWLKHVRGAAPLTVTDQSDALPVGSCTHLLLAAHYARQLPDARYPGFRENCPSPEQVLEALKAAGLSAMVALEVERLFEGYVEHWGADDGLTTMAVEYLVGVPGNYTSRYDWVGFVEDGRHDGLWAMDHKTCASSTDLDDFEMNGEIVGEAFSYILGGVRDVFGAPLSGVCINALFKSTKTAPPRYQRRWFTFAPQVLNDFGSDQGSWNLWLDLCQRRNYWPRSLHGCMANRRRCRFWEHCRSRKESELVQRPPIEEEEE